MPKRKKQESEQSRPESDPADDRIVTEVVEPESNGHADEPEPVEAEPVETSVEMPEPPAKVKYQVEGTPRAVQAAARKIANQPVAPPPAPESEEPPADDTDVLLASGHNMVVVRRTFPKTVEMTDGSKRRCATKLPDRYDCPTTREKIENDVFERFGGSEYKCTVHPMNAEGTILGYFTIEHPNPEEPPYFPDDPVEERPFDTRSTINTTGGDPTMRETDGLAKLRADAERRLERARLRKEMKELDAETKRLEDEIDEKPVASVAPSGESEQIKKLLAEIAEKDRLLSEKQVNDRFDKLETTLASIVTAIAAPKPVEKSGESDLMKFITKKMDADSAQITALMTAITTKAPAPVRSSGDDLDTFLSRAEKLKALTGGGGEGKGSRLSELENRLIDMSFDRLTGGGDEGGAGGGEGVEVEDVAKLAVKEFAPILKTFVEKKMEQDASSGTAPTKEREKQIYEESAKMAVAKIAEALHAQGIQLTTGPDGNLLALTGGKPAGKVVVPPRHAGTKVVSEERGAGGVVKKISIQPTDLSKKQPEAAAAAPTGEGGDVKHGVFPMLGEGGATLKIPFPVHPGEMKYDRKFAVDFVLSGIRSEIRQGFPQKAAENKIVESYVAADAIEYLDDELLNSLEAIDSGPQLETLLTESGGDRAQIDEIKKAGEVEVVASFLRRLIKTIQTEWIKEKAKSAK